MAERFSQRMGITPVTTALQIDSIDHKLRVGLWNTFYATAQNALDISDLETMWSDLLAIPLDDMPYQEWQEAMSEFKWHFFQCAWWGVYDFIEFAATLIPAHLRPTFIKQANLVMDRERSGYRFVAERIGRIIDPLEVQAIEDAVALASPAGSHLERALALLADRQQPDYRNSIKESISAVEAACCTLAGDPKATLGQALKVIEAQGITHPALKGGFTQLYGWTSDDQGIRHALLDEPTLDFADAKFMLVACSAFVNYLLAKGATA